MPKQEYSKRFGEAVKSLSKAVQTVSPERACLFGSAVEVGIKAADYDVLIISKSFEDVLFFERQNLVTFSTQKPIDLWPYTAQEFSALYPKTDRFRESIERNHIGLL